MASLMDMLGEMIGKVFDSRFAGIIAMLGIAAGAVVSIAVGFRVTYVIVTMIGAS